ncbi:ferredoxin [Curtobacterium flaccumfaciens pv. flaccumfaciens]
MVRSALDVFHDDVQAHLGGRCLLRRGGCVVSGGAGAGAGVVSLHVDWTRCRGRGLCTELFAERLERDEWGYPIARAGTPGARAGGDPGDPGVRAGNPGDRGTPDTGTRDVPVRPHERAAAADAVAMCPPAGAPTGGAVSSRRQAPGRPSAQYQCGLTLISWPHAPQGDP